jgi:epoxyqueuosine reductase
MGKHTNVINSDIGSFFFLATILVNKDLQYDIETEDLCRNCTLCINACPTGAIYDEYVLDSNLCISYQTIENHEEIPEELNLSGWIFGCDICQDVCPYNSKKFYTDDLNFFPKKEINEKSFDELLNLSEEEFNETFAGTPIKRTKYKGWIKNLNKYKKENLK